MAQILDFTLEAYRRLLDAILESGYRTVAVDEYLNDQSQTNIAVMRHDVDRRPETALTMAKIEKKRDVKATYYFRYLPDVYKTDIVRSIADMGHEIGYHYEVLDKADGDVDQAITLFKEELLKMREDFQVRTVCMHGNPIQPWKNLTIFKGRIIESFGITGEAYLSVDFKNIAYFTDTGRRWDRRYSVKDHAPGNLAEGFYARDTDHLIEVIREKRFESLYMVIHPNRWNEFGPEWLSELIWQNIKNLGKTVLMKREY